MNDPYIEILKLMREEGKKEALTDIEFAEVKESSPLKFSIAGTSITKQIYVIGDVSGIEAGDIIAVKRVGEINLVLGKVSEI